MNRSKAWRPHYPADFGVDTRHLTLEETGAYLLLLDHHFVAGFVPGDIQRIARIFGESPQKTRKLWQVLSHFFYKKDGNFYQKRMEREISKAAEIAEKRSAAGRKGGLANAIANAQAIADTTTTTTTYKEKKETKKRNQAARRTRLSADWKLSDELRAYCKKKRPDLDPDETAEAFKDFWLGDGRPKADWSRAFQTWVRNEKRKQGQSARPVRPAPDTDDFDKLLRWAQVHNQPTPNPGEGRARYLERIGA